MDNNKIFLIVFVCIAVVHPMVQTSTAGGVSKYQQKDEGPCDSCPLQGKCVPKVSCPAHVRPGTSNPECHLKSGNIGICCYTGPRHAAKSDRNPKARFHQRKRVDVQKTAHNASKMKWKKWSERSRNVLAYSDDTVVSSTSPDFGHQLSVEGTDEETGKLGEGALLNLFTVQELKEQQIIDVDELAVGYGEAYEGAYCPPQPSCPDPPCPYRSINGECNNPHHPTWGAANTGYERLLPPEYSDGIWALRTSKCGNFGEPLPSPRAISTTMLLEGHHPSDKHNFMFAQISQFIAHDVSAAVIFSIGNGSAISCCSKDGGCLPPEKLHYACAPIAVHPKDEFFSHFHKTCLNFVRAQLAPSPDCSSGYAKQMNGATHFLDLSQLYGKTKKKQNELRGPEGCLKVFNDYGRELPPLTDRPECLSRGESACFDSGDHHGNQLITLTVLHTMFTREHNRIVHELTRLNPDCDDDTKFRLAKKILQAMYQHIVYNEWLPLVIGPELMKTFGLAATCDGYAMCYDPEVNPAVLAEFAAGAFRFGHSTVADQIKVGCPDSNKASELISVTEVMFDPSRMRLQYFNDRLVKGMLSQPMQRVDPFFTHGLTRYMFRAGNAFGLDLAAMNIQRGRDFGNQPYNEYRKLCGLEPFNSIDDFPPRARERLSSAYGCSDDIDLWIGGILEKPVEGGIVGPTFAYIIAEQFSRLKKGDSYYYEYGPDHNPGAFTPSQLAQIKRSNMARILCDNLDRIEITSMPPSAFFRSDLPGNEPLDCEDPTIPSIDLSCFEIV